MLLHSFCELPNLTPRENRIKLYLSADLRISIWAKDRSPLNGISNKSLRRSCPSLHVLWHDSDLFWKLFRGKWPTGSDKHVASPGFVRLTWHTPRMSDLWIHGVIVQLKQRHRGGALPLWIAMTQGCKKLSLRLVLSSFPCAYSMLCRIMQRITSWNMAGHRARVMKEKLGVGLTEFVWDNTCIQ